MNWEEFYHKETPALTDYNTVYPLGVKNTLNKNLLDLYQTDMEIDIMKRIIADLPRADVWSMYRDPEFRSKAIDEYWAERLD